MVQTFSPENSSVTLIPDSLKVICRKNFVFLYSMNLVNVILIEAMLPFYSILHFHLAIT